MKTTSNTYMNYKNRTSHHTNFVNILKRTKQRSEPQSPIKNKNKSKEKRIKNKNKNMTPLSD